MLVELVTSCNHYRSMYITGDSRFPAKGTVRVAGKARGNPATQASSSLVGSRHATKSARVLKTASTGSGHRDMWPFHAVAQCSKGAQRFS